MIRDAGLKDIDAIVDIQLLTLPDILISRMGEAYLKGCFFPTVLKSSSSFTIVYDNAGQVKSFVIFAYNGRMLDKAVKARQIKTGIYFSRRIFKDKRLALEVFSYSFLRTLHLNENIRNLPDLPELYLVATHPSAFRNGMAKELVKKGIKKISSQTECDGCIVKTPYSNACRFYNNLGFKSIGEEIIGNTQKKIMLYRFRDTGKRR